MIPARRLLLLAAACALSAYLMWRNRWELLAAVRLLRHVEPGGLALAALAEAGMIAGIIGGYVALFRLAGHSYPLGRLTVVWLATNLVNQIVPSAGVVAAAVFVAWAPRSVPAGITLYAVGAHGFLDYLAFAVLTVATLGLRAGRENVPWPILAAGGLSVLVSVAATLGAVLLLRERAPVERAIGALLAWVARTAARVSRRLAFDPGRVTAQAIHAIDGLADALRRGPGMLVPFGLALAVQVLRPLQIVLIGAALRVGVDLLDASAAYVSAGLATYWTFLPGGIGVYGGTLTRILAHIMRYRSAAAITIAQRTLNFWAPMLAGAVAFFWLELRGGSGTRDSRRAGPS